MWSSCHNDVCAPWPFLAQGVTLVLPLSGLDVLVPVRWGFFPCKCSVEMPGPWIEHLKIPDGVSGGLPVEGDVVEAGLHDWDWKSQGSGLVHLRRRVDGDGLRFEGWFITTESQDYWTWLTKDGDNPSTYIFTAVAAKDYNGKDKGDFPRVDRWRRLSLKDVEDNKVEWLWRAASKRRVTAYFNRLEEKQKDNVSQRGRGEADGEGRGDSARTPQLLDGRSPSPRSRGDRMGVCGRIWTSWTVRLGLFVQEKDEEETQRTALLVLFRAATGRARQSWHALAVTAVVLGMDLRLINVIVTVAFVAKVVVLAVLVVQTLMTIVTVWVVPVPRVMSERASCVVRVGVTSATLLCVCIS